MKIQPVLSLLALGVALSCAPGGPGPGSPDRAAAPEEPPGLENGSFSAELNGFNIHYEVHGRGPVLMTLPNSWGLNLAGLRALYRPLEEHLTMVYFDPRGMGGSDPVREDADMGTAAVRADFDALRRHLGLEKVHAIGWSNGAMNLILHAAEHGETLTSAIFLHGVASFTEEDIPGFVEQHPDYVQAYTGFQQEMQAWEASDAEKTARLREFNFSESFPRLFADPEAARELLPELWADARFSWAHARYAESEWPTFDFRDRLAAIATRSLVLAGAHDMLKPEVVRELHDGLPDSRFRVFENSGHFAPVEEPEAFVAAVLEFLGPA